MSILKVVSWLSVRSNEWLGDCLRHWAEYSKKFNFDDSPERVLDRDRSRRASLFSSLGDWPGLLLSIIESKLAAVDGQFCTGTRSSNHSFPLLLPEWLRNDIKSEECWIQSQREFERTNRLGAQPLTSFTLPNSQVLNNYSTGKGKSRWRGKGEESGIRCIPRQAVTDAEREREEERKIWGKKRGHVCVVAVWQQRTGRERCIYCVHRLKTKGGIAQRLNVVSRSRSIAWAGTSSSYLLLLLLFVRFFLSISSIRRPPFVFKWFNCFVFPSPNDRSTTLDWFPYLIDIGMKKRYARLFNLPW